MPILLPQNLPATALLREEGVRLVDPAATPARMLHIALVNLMPDKPTTERQIARLLGAAQQNVALHLLWPSSQRSRRTPPEHIQAFYEDLATAENLKLDGVIITGAPVETLPFDQVRFWPELAALYDLCRARGWPSLNICWAALAALHHWHGVASRALPVKAFGVFDQTVRQADDPMMQGLPAQFPLPVSRHSAAQAAALPAAGIHVLADSPESGISIAADPASQATLVFDHMEYDSNTLLAEYRRDRSADLPTPPPQGAAMGGAHAVPWRPFAHLLMRNWLAGVERIAISRQPSDLLGWLLESAGADPGGTQILVQAHAHALAQACTLAEIATACATLGAPLTALRRLAQSDGIYIEIVLEPEVPDQLVARLAKKLRARPYVRHVLHRRAGVDGAVFCGAGLDQAA